MAGLSRRELLLFSGTLVVSLGGGSVTASLLSGCSSNDDHHDSGTGDADDTGYDTASAAGLRSRRYAAAEV